MVKAGKNQAAAKAFVQTVLSPQGQAKLQRGRLRQAVSTAAAGGAPDRAVGRERGARRASPWRSGGVVIAVVMAFLLLPIVALFTYQPVHELIDGFGTKVATDAIVVSLKTNAIAFALMIGLGTPFAYIIGRAPVPRAQRRDHAGRVAAGDAAGSRRAWRCWSRSAASGCSGTRSACSGSISRSRQAAVVIAILFVASPFYLRGAIAAFEAVDATLLDVAGHARRRAGAADAARRGPARRRRARRGGGGRVRARDRRVRRDDPVRRQLPGHDADAAARGLLAVRCQPRPGGRDRRAADHRQRCDPARPPSCSSRSWTSSRSTSPSPGERSIFAPR